MGVLANARHERFAQEVAKGASATAAYAAAGYKPCDQNASRLMRNDKVRNRVTELKGAIAQRTTLTVASLTERLLRIASKGEDNGGASMLSVARAALMDAAKLNGLVIDRSTRELSEDQMRALLDQLAEQPGMAKALLAQLA